MTANAQATTLVTGAAGTTGAESVEVRKARTIRSSRVGGQTRLRPSRPFIPVEHSIPPASASGLPFPSKDSSTVPERSMSHECDRASAPPAIGASFDEVVLPHIEAAHRLARWLMRNEPDADDVVQEASMRAFRYFRTFHGGDGRAWFLRIVRNTCSGWRHRLASLTDPFDEQQHLVVRPSSDPEALLIQGEGATAVARAMRTLPDRLRELLVLREFDGLSYRELADAMGIPIGTVMSGLSRARVALRGAMAGQSAHSGSPTIRILENRRSTRYRRERRGRDERRGKTRWKRLHSAAQPSHRTLRG